MYFNVIVHGCSSLQEPGVLLSLLPLLPLCNIMASPCLTITLNDTAKRRPAVLASYRSSASVSPAVDDHSVWSWSCVVMLAAPLSNIPVEVLYKCENAITATSG